MKKQILSVALLAAAANAQSFDYTLSFDEEFDGTIASLTTDDYFVIDEINMPGSVPNDAPLYSFAPGIITNIDADGEFWVTDSHMTLATAGSEVMQSGSLHHEFPTGVSDFEFWTKMRYSQPETDWSDLQYLRCNLVDSSGNYVATFQLLDGFTGNGMRVLARTSGEVLYDTAPGGVWNQSQGRYRGFTVKISRTGGTISYIIRSDASPTTTALPWTLDYSGSTTISNTTEIHGVEVVFQRPTGTHNVGNFAVDYLSFHGDIADVCDIDDSHHNFFDLDDVRDFVENYSGDCDLDCIEDFITDYLDGCS